VGSFLIGTPSLSRFKCLPFLFIFADSMQTESTSELEINKGAGVDGEDDEIQGDTGTPARDIAGSSFSGNSSERREGAESDGDLDLSQPAGGGGHGRVAESQGRAAAGEGSAELGVQQDSVFETYLKFLHRPGGVGPCSDLKEDTDRVVGQPRPLHKNLMPANAVPAERAGTYSLQILYSTLSPAAQAFWKFFRLGTWTVKHIWWWMKKTDAHMERERGREFCMNTPVSTTCARTWNCCLCAYMCVLTCVLTCVCLHVCAYMCVLTCVCLHVCAYMCARMQDWVPFEYVPLYLTA